MDFFSQVIQNGILNASILSWFVAQLLKVVLILIIQKRVDFSRFIGAGGMPSSHSSFVCTMTVMVYRITGAASMEFAFATIFSMIVMYDAAGVRRAAGQQAKILNRIIEHWEDNENDPNFMEERLKELLGHTPFEVIVGALLGIFIGCIFPM